jgi:hypothetical protein
MEHSSHIPRKLYLPLYYAATYKRFNTTPLDMPACSDYRGVLPTEVAHMTIYHATDSISKSTSLTFPLRFGNYTYPLDWTKEER